MKEICFLGEPHSVPNATTDPFKTLFVARIVSNFLIN